MSALVVLGLRNSRIFPIQIGAKQSEYSKRGRDIGIAIGVVTGFEEDNIEER